MPYALNTGSEKLVAEYAGIPLPAVFDFGIFEYWALYRDAFIYAKASTEEGREWLRNAWRLTQTEPETEKLHKKFGRKGE